MPRITTHVTTTTTIEETEPERKQESSSSLWEYIPPQVYVLAAVFFILALATNIEDDRRDTPQNIININNQGEVQQKGAYKVYRTWK